jgi:hypothetical protein
MADPEGKKAEIDKSGKISKQWAIFKNKRSWKSNRSSYWEK